MLSCFLVLGHRSLWMPERWQVVWERGPHHQQRDRLLALMKGMNKSCWKMQLEPQETSPSCSEG